MDFKSAHSPEVLASSWFSALTSTASCLTVGAALVISNGNPVAAQDAATGNISFTADNAAQVYLNGELLKDSNNNPTTNDWTKPFKFTDLSLKQGENVIGIAAWDQEGIAAMSGQFVMPDGTKFGSTNYEAWLVFPAAKDFNSGNSVNNPFNKNELNPLSKYKDILSVPVGWNEISYSVSDFEDREWTSAEACAKVSRTV